jgi:putative endonuclease
MTPSLKQVGATGEELAAGVLKKQGYKVLERNYRTPLGEIDLVARHRGVLVLLK